MNNNTEDEIEPLAVTIATATKISGESKSQIYNLVADGELEAIKSRRRTLITYASLKKRIASLPRVKLQRKPRKLRGNV